MRTALVLASLLAPIPLPARPAVQVADATEALLRAVPADAVGFVLVRDLAGLRARADQNDWFRLLRDPEVRPTVETIERALASALGRDESAPHAPSLRALLGSLNGSLVAFTRLDAAEGWALVLAPEGDRTALDRLLAEARAELAERAGSTGGRELAGSDGVLTTVWSSGDGEGAPLVLESRWQGRHVFVHGHDAEAARALAAGAIARLRGRAEGGIGRSAGLREARASAPFAGSIVAHLDLVRILERTGGDASVRADGGPEPPVLGRFFHELRWLHAEAEIGEGERAQLSLTVAAPRDGTIAGWLDLLGPLPLDLLALVPKEASAVSAFHVDLPRAFDRFAAMLGERSQEARERLEASLDVAGGMLGCDLRDDVIARIEGSYVEFMMEVPHEEVQAAFGGSLVPMGVTPESIAPLGAGYLLGLDDSEAVAGVASRMLERLEFAEDVTTREHGEHRIHSLASEKTTFHWSFLDGAFAGALHPTALEAVLAVADDPSRGSVLENERFATFFRAYGNAPYLSASDTRVCMRALLDAGQVFTAIGEGEDDEADGVSIDLHGGSDGVGLRISGLPLPSPRPLGLFDGRTLIVLGHRDQSFGLLVETR